MNLPRRLASYGAALVVPIIAFALREFLAHRFPGQMPPFITLYPAVVVVAILCGFAPGVVATIVSALIAAYWAIAFNSIFSLSPAGGALALAVFVVTGIAISLLAELHQRARSRAAVYDKEVSLRDTESALRRYELLASQGLDVILFIRMQDGRILEANQAAVEDYGYSREELLALSIFDLRAPETMDLLPGQMAEAYLKTLRFETLHRRKDGTVFPVEVISRGVAVGDERMLIASIRDITERKRNEEVLRNSQAELDRNNRELRALLGAATATVEGRDFPPAAMDIFEFARQATGAQSGCLALLNADGSECQMLVCDGSGIQLLNCASGEGRCILNPGSPEALLALREQACRTKRPAFQNDFPQNESLPAGAYEIRNFLFAPLEIGGDVHGVIGLANKEGGFTESDGQTAVAFGKLAAGALQKSRYLDALRASEERFRSLYENATIGLYRTTPSGKILLANPALVRMLGFSSFDELAQRNLEEEARREPIYDRVAFKRRMESDEVCDLESAWTRKDGSTVFVRETAKAIRNAAGEALYYEGTVEDITERKQAELALRRNEALYRAVVEDSGERVIFTDADRLLLYRSPSQQLTGFPDDERLGHDMLEVIHPDEVQIVRQAWIDVLNDSEEPCAVEYRLRFKDGGYRWVEASIRNMLANPNVQAIVARIRDVSARRIAQEALRNSEAQFRGILENLQDAFFRSDATGHLTFAAPSAPEMFGYDSVEQMLGLPVEALYADAQERLALLEKLHRTERLNDWVCKARRRDGTSFWASLSVRLYRDEEGRVTGNEGFVRDISERMRSQEALCESEETNRITFEQAAVGIAHVAADGRWLRVNDRLCDIVGYTREEMMGLRFYDVTRPDDMNLTQVLIRQILAGVADSFSEEKRYIRKDGSTLWVHLTVSLVRNAEGEPRFFVAVTQDINARKEVEQRLRQSEAEARARADELAALLDAVPAATFIAHDRQCWSITSSRAALEMLRLPPGTNVSMTALDGQVPLHFRILQGEQALALDELPLQRAAATGCEVRASELSIVFDDGSSRTIYGNTSPLFDGNGEVRGSVGAYVDITELKRIELELRRSRHSLQAAIDAAKLGVWSRDLLADQATWDDHLREIYGVSAGEVVPYSKFLNLVLPEDREAVITAMQQRVNSNEQISCEYRVRKAGEVRWLHSRGSCVRDESGKVIGVSGITMDITDHKRAEENMRSLQEQIRIAQRTEALGRLAGGMAHDFNNILMIIRSYTELLQAHVPERGSGAGYLVEMLKATDRASGLTGQLLAFSRKQIAVPVVLDLNAVVKDTSKMLRLIGEDVELVLSAAPELWHVQTDPDQMVQVLMNLCVNARDAMPNGGKITIAIENLSCALPGEHPHLPPGDFVKLSVTDTGVGMTKEVMEHIFEPFFTTKPQGKGTGLGLSTVYGIVTQSGGYVWAESEPDCGASIVACLPRANKIAPKPETPIDRALPRGTETVMVVDDERALRDSICEALRDAGYTVLSAGPGEEALSTAERHEAQIAVLITDVVMPMMNGRELSEKLTGIRPGLKTIFMSGYTDDWVVRSGISELRVAFLQKPFSMSALARKLREVIDSA